MSDPAIPEDSADELFDGAPCGYLAALPDGTLVKVNATFLSWTGHSREALLARTRFQSLLTVPGRIYYDTHIGPLLQMQGFVREVAFDLPRAQGEPLPVLVNLSLQRNSDNAPHLLRMTVFDATDRRKYERELLNARRMAEQSTQVERLAREEAERANRAKDDILALVSHELKTPLAAILGWTQVLQKRNSGDADLGHALSVIERNTRLQARLVDDLLDMSRVISGKLRLDVQRVDLALALESAIETVRPAALAKNIRVRTVLDPSAIVAGDPERLQQVFWNLLSNSVKFTPKDGCVTISMARVNSHVEVTVTDDGQGMAPELLAHVFERFRQSNSGTTGRTTGLGLGLALVRHLVEMHGGRVEALSEGEGRGSTFTVNLPLVVVHSSEGESRVHPPTAATTLSESIAVSLAGMRVLVVDDERDARELLWRVLTDAGAEVVGAGSATEALSVIERVRPHVLISDIGLPGEDGYELIRKVRMLGEEVGRVPAIALTALGRLQDRTRALLAGFQIHLAKPVDSRELAITVASLAARLK
ncbi:MAG TPA: ATP-binding protein [Steroidobacteraceae bacterium]|jgi:PAS domain S-box-containing protein